MELLIVAVGRSRDAPITALVDEYARRCPWPIRWVEVQARDIVPPERRMVAEAELLLAAIPSGAAVVALVERGRDLASADLARQLGDWRDRGRRTTALLIGGPDGLPRVPAPPPTCGWRSAARPGHIGWSG